jgi:uncharacterized protein (DUF58 family)
LNDSLLTPEFVRELEALRGLLRARARSGGSGASTARRRGRGAEFHEHRPYAAGDDVGRLDWLAFARTGHPVSKEHRADEDVVVRLVVDGSGSTGFGAPHKLDMATRVAAGVAYLSLSVGHRVEVVAASGSVVRALPIHRGRPSLGAVLRELSAVGASGDVRVEDAISHALAASERPGVLMVLSDFLDDGPVLDALRRARHAGHDVTLVHVLAREEVNPRLEGDLTLVDSETGETVEVSADEDFTSAYERRLSALCEQLQSFARRSGTLYVRATSDEAAIAVVRRALAGG